VAFTGRAKSRAPFIKALAPNMKFELLAGKIALGSAYSKDYTEWAESLLYEGIDSENVAILAGLGYERDPDSEDIETYFQKSLIDLGLSLLTAKHGFKVYAKAICEQIICGEIAPEEGVKILETFYAASDYESIYSIWDELNEDLWMVNDRDGCIFNTGLTIENKYDYIKNVAVQFIALLETELPDHFFYLSACPECSYIGESKLEAIEKSWMSEKFFRLIYRRGQTQRAICGNCKRPFPNNMSDYEGRKQYLNKKC
jgi:hypothetical protein